MPNYQTVAEKIKEYGRSFKGDPIGYAENYLHVHLNKSQKEVLLVGEEAPYRVAVQAANNVGKSFLAAVIARYRFDCYVPSITLVTAPVKQSVQDVIFRELRVLSPFKDGFLPKESRLQGTRVDHFVHGFTSSNEESFKGRHSEYMTFILDEAIRLERWIWTSVKSMFKADGKHRAYAFFNPTTTSSPLYAEQNSGDWRTVRMSAIDHENIQAGLLGLAQPYVSAIDYNTIISRLRNECEIITEPDHSDFEFNGKWYRPLTPEFEVQVLGRYPKQSENAVWSDHIWMLCLPERAIMQHWNEPNMIQIGCDVARMGRDATVIHARRGGASVLHESHRQWNGAQVAQRLKEIAHMLHPESAHNIPIVVDEVSVGASVIDHGNDYNFIGINSGKMAHDPTRFPNIRSELWFITVELAKQGLIDLSRIRPNDREQLRQQLLAPRYKLDAVGRRVVESKDDTKTKIGRSPDDADAFNLAFYPV